MLKIPLWRVDPYYSPGWGVLGSNAPFSCVPPVPLHPDVRTALLRSRPPGPFQRLREWCRPWGGHTCPLWLGALGPVPREALVSYPGHMCPSSPAG